MGKNNPAFHTESLFYFTFEESVLWPKEILGENVDLASSHILPVNKMRLRKSKWLYKKENLIMVYYIAGLAMGSFTLLFHQCDINSDYKVTYKLR